MKIWRYVFFSFLFSASALLSQSASISLDGFWKFGVFDGEGSSYRDVAPMEGDILVDNRDLDSIELGGKWTTSVEPDRESRFWGEDYLKRYFQEGDSEAFVRFRPLVPEGGYYDAYIYYPFGIHLTSHIEVEHKGGLHGQHLSLRNRCGQWVWLGRYELGEGRNTSVKVTALSGSGMVVADAVLFRKANGGQAVRAEHLKKKVVTSDFDDTGWDDLLVPGHWGMLNKFAGYSGKGWYRRSFDLPADWDASEKVCTRLRFDGVYHLANVYLNGEHLGQHRGGFTPFEFDVTDKLQQKNLLVVSVDNNFLVGATWNWGGITRGVSLQKTSDAFLRHQYIHAEPNLKTGEAEVSVRVRLENRSVRLRKGEVEIALSKDGRELLTLSKPVHIHVNADHVIELRGRLSREQVSLWHFDRPELYNVETRFKEKGRILHSLKDRFGIRKIEVTKDEFRLNGEPVRLAGFNRVSDHRYWGTAEPESFLRADLKLAKDAGANFTRIMHGTQNKRLLEICDEYGLMVIEEINVRELTNPELTSPDYPLAKRWMRRMFERDSNHASIIGWSVGNELSRHYDYVDEMITFVKSELDSHRLVSCVSNTGYRENETPENDPLGLSDLSLQNCYMQTPEVMIRELRARWPEKPIFFSEFGIRRFVEESLDGDLPELTEWYSHLRGRNRFVIGASLWTLNDYRSGYAQTLESENRAWGLVNVWRQKRRLFKRQQIENSPVKGLLSPAIDPAKGSLVVTIPIRGRDDYPSYSMRDYRLQIEFLNKGGRVVRNGGLKLPLLTPEAGEWKGEVTWEPLLQKAHSVRLRLLSSNGFVRFERTDFFAAPASPAIASVQEGDGKVRINFERNPDAVEYFVSWTGQDGVKKESKRTLDSYLDITGLASGRSYHFVLFAVNGKGVSGPSASVQASPGDSLLPPVVWRSFIVNDSLVIGYSGEAEDQAYQVRVGQEADSLARMEEANVRGMFVVENLGSEYCSFQIRRQVAGEWSQWSPVLKAE